MAEQVQQQPSKEKFDELMGKEKKAAEAKTHSSNNNNKHWVLKCGKDVFYLSTPHYRAIWAILKWLFNNPEDYITKKLVNIIRKAGSKTETENNNTEKQLPEISLEEVDNIPNNAIDLADVCPHEAENLLQEAINKYEDEQKWKTRAEACNSFSPEAEHSAAPVKSQTTSIC